MTWAGTPDYIDEDHAALIHVSSKQSLLVLLRFAVELMRGVKKLLILMQIPLILTVKALCTNQV